MKRTIQDHLQEGLLLIVGTGLSIAEGIPGMGPLADQLKAVIPPKLTAAPDPAWNDVVAALDSGDNLKAAMAKLAGTLTSSGNGSMAEHRMVS